MKEINEEHFFEANQLIKIAKIESSISADGKNALVIGEKELAEAVAELFGCCIAKNESDIKKITAQNNCRKFCAVFLFSKISDESLLRLADNDAVIIDMIEYPKDQTIFYNASAQFRRIRVVSLFKDEKF